MTGSFVSHCTFQLQRTNRVASVYICLGALPRSKDKCLQFRKSLHSSMEKEPCLWLSFRVAFKLHFYYEEKCYTISIGVKTPALKFGFRHHVSLLRTFLSISENSIIIGILMVRRIANTTWFKLYFQSLVLFSPLKETIF